MVVRYLLQISMLGDEACAAAVQVHSGMPNDKSSTTRTMPVVLDH